MTLLSLVPILLAQAPECAPNATRITPRGVTIFTEAQDVALGDAVAAQIQRDFTVFRQPGLTAPLERIAARLLKHLPPNEFKFTFSLIEIPEANAFVLPGGRVFVSRKLVAFVESEDELAGVIAHEMGHVLARQASIAISREFKDILKVTAVKDRDDVFDKYNQFLDNERRKPGTRVRRPPSPSKTSPTSANSGRNPGKATSSCAPANAPSSCRWKPTRKRPKSTSTPSPI
jgi:hypothetical protein